MSPTKLQSNYQNAQQEIFFHHPARVKVPRITGKRHVESSPQMGLVVEERHSSERVGSSSRGVSGVVSCSSARTRRRDHRSAKSFSRASTAAVLPRCL